jgi:hypothetical protein
MAYCSKLMVERMDWICLPEKERVSLRTGLLKVGHTVLDHADGPQVRHQVL